MSSKSIVGKTMKIALTIAPLCNSSLHGFVEGNGPIVIANIDGLSYAIGIVIG